MPNNRYKTLRFKWLFKRTAPHRLLYRWIQTQPVLPNVSYRRPFVLRNQKDITKTMTMILFLLLFIIPLIFQFNFGSKAVHGYISLKFWKVCIISYMGLILMTIANFFLTLNQLHETGIRDGLPLGGVIVIGVLFGILNLVIIGIQLYTKLHNK